MLTLVHSENDKDKGKGERVVGRPGGFSSSFHNISLFLFLFEFYDFMTCIYPFLCTIILMLHFTTSVPPTELYASRATLLSI